MPTQTAAGKIITFYSYKGGTGRSMALANVAWILASKGKRVLTLDWDLEAPGLHRYFYPFLVDKDLTASDGLIDFVLKFTTAAITQPARQDSNVNSTSETVAPGQLSSGDHQSGVDKDWYKPYANILRYAASLDWKFEGGGTLDFIPAGRQGPSYSTRVNSFNWQNFYDLLGGGTLLEAAKEKMRSEYDYILIDSRTGVSDTSGICTVQMPDVLVICFTLNNQSIEGAAAVANAVYDLRTKSEKPVRIFPVPMRLENAEKEKLRARKEHAKNKFKLFPNSLPGEDRDQYWGDVPIIYVPYYAYEEMLAAFGDNSADRISVLSASEQLASYLTDGEIKKLTPPTEEDRVRILAQYEGGSAAVSTEEEQNKFAESIFNTLAADDKERVRRVFTRLVRVAQPNEVGGDTLLRVESRDIEPNAFSILRPMINARLLELEQDNATGTYTVTIAQKSLTQNWKRLQGWIDADRDFLLWRQRLQVKVDEWEKSERDAGALLSGTLLTEAEGWLLHRGSELNNNETLYIKDSIEERNKQSPPSPELSVNKTHLDRLLSILGQTVREATPTIVGAAILFIIAVVFMGWYLDRQSTREREQNAKHARSTTHTAIGLDNLSKGSAKAAIEAFNTAIEIDPNNEDAYMNRGNAYRMLGDLDTAIVNYDLAIKINPNYPNPYYYRGLAYRSKGNKSLAIDDFAQVARLSDDKYWIVTANQRLQQLKEEVGVDVNYYYPDNNSEVLKNIIGDLNIAGYVTKQNRIEKVSQPPSIEYYFDEDKSNAEDIKDMMEKGLERQGLKFKFDVTKVTSLYPRTKARLSVGLPSLR